MTYTSSWIFLGLSILASTLGLTLLKGLENVYPWASLLSMYCFFIVSYYLRAKAVVNIPVVVAYAVWEAAGLALVIGVGMMFFQEYLRILQAVGLLCLLGGSYLVHIGTDKGKDPGQ